MNEEDLSKEDLWAESVVRKYNRRSGIRRLYCYPDGLKGSCYLELEFVIWGRVLFTQRLWRQKNSFS
jgi:hypothetical protein